jgi:hypothetical protein
MNDEFEVDPIMAKHGKHKINATYFSLRNLPIKLRSNLQHINLANIVQHAEVRGWLWYSICIFSHGIADDVS